MATSLPTNIDTSYGDDPNDPSRKVHQQHHDAIHAYTNDHDGRVGSAAHAGLAIVSATAPASPAADELWYDTAAKLLKRWDAGANAGAGAWEAAGSAAYVAKADDVEPVTEADTLTWHEGSLVAIAASSYHTIFDITTGGAELIGGAMIGASIGFRLTIDGTVVANRTANAVGDDVSGTDYHATVALFPAKANTSMKLELYNATGTSREHGWRVVTR